MQTQPRSTPGFIIRHAVAADVRLILDFIRKLAEYERLAQEVEVKIVELDLKRNRIQLSMKDV